MADVLTCFKGLVGMNKLLAAGTLLVLLSLGVHGELTGACWTVSLDPLNPPPVTECVDDHTKQECDDLFETPVVSALWMPATHCGTAPDTSGVGACTFTHTGATALDETSCKSLIPGLDTCWTENGCCVDGDTTAFNAMPYINETVCETLFGGTFHGAGSTCPEPYTPPEASGLCRLTSGTMAGICLDGSVGSDMNESTCAQLAGVVGSGYSFEADESCEKYMGACHISGLGGTSLDQTACEDLGQNATWLGYTCCVPDAITFSTSFPYFPVQTLYINEGVCEGLLGGSFQGIGSACDQPPNPAEPAGACMLTGGFVAGLCVDEWDDPDDPGQTIPLTGEMCRSLAGQAGSGYVFHEEMVCLDFSGACRFTEVMGTVLTEETCLGLAENTVWVDDACCVEDELIYTGGAPSIYMTEVLCESQLEGVFCGIGSSCEPQPIPAPEYPEAATPLIAMLLTAGMLALLLKRTR